MIQDPKDTKSINMWKGKDKLIEEFFERYKPGDFIRSINPDYRPIPYMIPQDPSFSYHDFWDGECLEIHPSNNPLSMGNINYVYYKGEYDKLTSYPFGRWADKYIFIGRAAVLLPQLTQI